MNKKVAFITLGCKVNIYETNAMAQKFLENGYTISQPEDFADIYVINTCTVTSMSDKKSRQMIRRAKQKNANALVVVTGCYAQVAKEEIEKIKEVDIVIGNNEKKDIVKYVESAITANVTDSSDLNEFIDFGNTTYTETTRAFIKVQDGCNNFCSYCIIPYSRGRIRSRKIENVISEIEDIASKGIKEVVLTGIHVSSYGKDFREDITLVDLLEAISKISGIERIRLSSLEPKIITKDFLLRLKKLNKVCNHFHLSLQSGCNATLQRMNRKYTTEEFEAIVKMIRDFYPDAALTTDIIVGFPGETDEEFDATYNFLRKINFMKMHVFKYSPRKGTMASEMPNQIKPQIKDERSNILLNLSNENEINFIEQYIGKEVEVLFEQKEGNYVEGHTKNYILVKAMETSILPNEIKTVLIKNRINNTLVQ
jgi:threonylcarbamoyladenosine tRNA methylthiotransferase MtaB